MAPGGGGGAITIIICHYNKKLCPPILIALPFIESTIRSLGYCIPIMSRLCRKVALGLGRGNGRRRNHSVSLGIVMTDGLSSLTRQLHETDRAYQFEKRCHSCLSDGGINKNANIFYILV